MATEGVKPVLAIYSTFLQRGYDQLIHDVALQNLDVTFALDRAGLVGADGATHAGNYDLAYLRCIPNMVVMAPSDENECRQMLTTAYHFPGPAAVRYPRGAGVGAALQQELSSIEIGKGLVKRQGKGVAILAFGSMVAPSLKAADELNATVADMRFVKPLDVELVKRLAKDHDYLVTVEEGCTMGGAGSAVAEALAAEGIVKPLLILGLPDHFIDQGDPGVLLASVGLDAHGIGKSIRERFGIGEPRLVVNNNERRPIMLIVTHGGKFHADDAWAVAVIKVCTPRRELVRTRDQAIIDRGDIVIDVGGIWDPALGRFDHHQKGFSGARQSGVPYASAGLVWREYGGAASPPWPQSTPATS
jgi:transketolase C-terminal domain/subunit